MRAGAAATAVTPGSYAGTPSAPEVSPLVRAGKIINPLTHKDIKIGGELYNRLVEQGFEPDIAAGVLRPPAAGTPGSPTGSTGGKAGLRPRRAAAGQARGGR